MRCLKASKSESLEGRISGFSRPTLGYNMIVKNVHKHGRRWETYCFWCVDNNVGVRFVVALSKIHPAGNTDADGIKSGSNFKMTDNHAAEYPTTACLVHWN